MVRGVPVVSLLVSAWAVVLSLVVGIMWPMILSVRVWVVLTGPLASATLSVVVCLVSCSRCRALLKLGSRLRSTLGSFSCVALVVICKR